MPIDFRRNIISPTTSPVTIEATAVHRVQYYKYLGVILNDKLKWRDHVACFG